MKILYLGTIFLALLIIIPTTIMVDVESDAGTTPPPPIVFSTPPTVIVLPGTNIYVVPAVPEEIFFTAGWWWRQWQNRWFRSKYYDRGWVFYKGYPVWYKEVPSGWRENYANHTWQGQVWHYQHIPHEQLYRGRGKR
jgi:hypothetical protein